MTYAATVVIMKIAASAATSTAAASEAMYSDKFSVAASANSVTDVTRGDVRDTRRECYIDSTSYTSYISASDGALSGTGGNYSYT